MLLTETTPGTFLRGRVLAGLAVGLPLTTLVPLGSIAAGTRPLHGITFAVVGSGFSLMAALFALGPGCAYPIYEERELWGAETVAPSMLVLMGYSFVVMGGTTLGLGVTWFGLTGNLVMTTILISGLSVYLVLTVGLPVLSYWYSRRRYRRYVLEWTHSLWRGIGTRHGDFIHERLPDRLPEPPLEDGVVPECQTNHRPNAIDAGTPLRFVFTPCAPVSSWPVNAPVTKIATNRSAIQTNESIPIATPRIPIPQSSERFVASMLT